MAKLQFESKNLILFQGQIRIFANKIKMMELNILDRFLTYVKIDTQSNAESLTVPSTAKQKNLGILLVEELQSLGVSDAAMDEKGYVYATITSNADKDIPVICFCAHMDTSPDCSGKDVRPVLHKNYNGSDIVLPDDTNQIIRTAEHPDLKNQIGNTVITASGNTLLGADNKSGIAAIMAAVEYWMKNPDVPHGKIRILFTPDEEIGRGVDHVDMDRLGADFGYTIDGEKKGSMEDETFSADMATIKISGVSTHPGFALGKLESAIKIAADIIASLPDDSLSPETTSGKEGFIHPTKIEAIAEKGEIKFILRDFTTEKLQSYKKMLEDITAEVIRKYPKSSAIVEVVEQYRNMKEVLDNHPQVSAFAKKAIEKVGLTPIVRSIRGGTDGSRLSFMGLPCPNIFAGEHAFHSKHEWVSLEDMEKSAEVIIALAQIWAEEGA